MIIDEVKIIAQHHVKPDGSGFPAGLTNHNLNPIVCLFILAYDFTNVLVQSTVNMEDIDSEQILALLGDSYQQGNFEKPYLALRRALKLDAI